MADSEKGHAAQRRARYTAVFTGLIIAFAVLTVWNINSGSVSIPVGRIAKIIFTTGGSETERDIIWHP